MSTIVEKRSPVTDLSLLVQADKLRLLYRQSFPAIFISLFNAALLMAILWSTQERHILLTWFGVLLVAFAVRLVLFSRYWKVLPQDQHVLAWESPYFITLVLSSLVWGLGCIYIMPPDSPLHQTVILYFLIGMSGGAISVYSAHRVMLLTVITILLLPVTGYFLVNGDIVFVLMAIGAIVFFLSAIRSTGVLGLALQQNFLKTHQLEISSEEADRRARVDELTGLYNRRAFYEFGQILTINSQRNKEEVAMILMDIDHFKTVNDSFGHAAGDAALIQIGEILLQRLRKSDVFARLGGEEFGILLPPKTSLDKAAMVAEELRHIIEATPVVFAGETFNITASFGVSSGESDLDMLVRQADMAMYQSKASGRNAVRRDVSE